MPTLSKLVNSAAGQDHPSVLLRMASGRQTAYVLHLILAVIFFSPFFLLGHILFSNTDLLTDNYPALLVAKKNFLNLTLGLWNPYLLSGAPQSVVAGTPILFPENWLLFLVPDRFFFSVLTFFAFAKMWLIGIFAYRFYCFELLNRRWALFASVTYQLSGWMIWVTVSYVALSIFLYYTILLTIVWTIPRRTSLANYLLLSIVTTMMLMAGNIAHSAYALLGAGVLFLYRTFSLGGARFVIDSVALFTASCTTALLIFCARLLPIVETLRSSGELSCCKPEFRNASFLIARLFDTAIFGISYLDSQEFFTNIAPPILKNRNLPALFSDFQSHVTMPSFFGVAAALLSLWALVSRKSPKTLFWSVYTVIVLGLVTFFQPFDVLWRMLVSSVYHPLSLHLLLPIGVSTLAARAGASLELAARYGRVSRLTVEFFVFAVVVSALFVLMVLMRNVESLSTVQSLRAQVLVAGLIVLGAMAVVGFCARPVVLCYLGGLLLFMIIASGLAAIFFVESDVPAFVAHLRNSELELLSFAMVALILVLALQGKTKAAWHTGLWGGTALCVLWFGMTLYPEPETLQPILLHWQALMLASIGALQLVIGASIFFLILSAIKSKRLPARSVYVAFFLLLLAEQVPAGKVHSYINLKPFYPANTFYPPRSLSLGIDSHPVELDLANYRVNYPNAMLQLPYYGELWDPGNEICASINEAYGIRSYGGYVDIIPNRTAWFFQNWVRPEHPESLCIYARAADDRFLDLSGVGYAFDPKTGMITRRSGALSRVMLFTQFTIAANGDDALGLLKEADFKPLETIVLQEDPGFQSRISPDNGKKLAFVEVTPDRLELQVQTDGPGLLFFNDSYNEGWSALINGVPQRIITSDYNFMSVPVPVGASRVILEYRPRSTLIGLACAGIGVSCILLFLAIYLIQRGKEILGQRDRLKLRYCYLAFRLRFAAFSRRPISRILACILSISLFQIVLSPVWGASQFVAPFRWKLTYVDENANMIEKTIVAPTGKFFIEGHAVGTLTVEMYLPECRAFDHYRLFVGPYKTDSSTRMPTEWEIFVRGPNDEWVSAGAENWSTNYNNNEWYEFPLRHELRCVDRVRMRVTGLGNEQNIFRLSQIVVNEANVFPRLRRIFAH